MLFSTLKSPDHSRLSFSLTIHSSYMLDCVGNRQHLSVKVLVVVKKGGKGGKSMPINLSIKCNRPDSSFYKSALNFCFVHPDIHFLYLALTF